MGGGGGHLIEGMHREILRGVRGLRGVGVVVEFHTVGRAGKCVECAGAGKRVVCGAG